MFTIIIPTHERPHLLHRTLQSLIAQSWQDFVVIIVSDSGHYLPPIHDLQHLAGRYIYLQRSDPSGNGPAQSRNMALNLVTTPYVMFLDDDDTFAVDHLARLAAHLQQQPLQQQVLFTSFKVQEEDRQTTPPTHLKTSSIDISQQNNHSLYILNRIPNSCLVFKRETLAELRFDSNMEIYEDWDFLLRCLQTNQLRYLPGESVTIHKSYVSGEANQRRGNSRHDLTVDVTLDIYRRFPAPHPAIAEQRRALLQNSGINYQEAAA